MRPVTASFLATVKGSHKMVARARVCSPGQVGTTPTGTEIPIIAGDVTQDSTADVGGSLDLTTHFVWPTLPSSLGAPYGQEVYVERGVQYGNGTIEYVGLGYFPIYSIEQSRSPNGEIRLSGPDRMGILRDSRVTQPIEFGSGASVQATMDFLVQDVLPGVPVVYDFPASTTYFTSTHIVDEDRLEFLFQIVNSFGKTMYFDYAGRLQVKTPPPINSPVWQVHAGKGGVLIQSSRQMSREGVYNGVVATGEAPGEAPPVRGVALNLDPASPILWGGPFGKVPRFFSSNFMTTNAQCQLAAENLLAKTRGVSYSMDFDTIPNPALECLDVVSVLPSPRSNAGFYVLDSVKYPLTADDSMRAVTRRSDF